MGKKKKNKDTERDRVFPLTMFRIQTEDAIRRRQKRLRVNAPPSEYKRDKAERFLRNETERVAQAAVDLVTEQIKPRIDLESHAGRNFAIVYSFGPAEFTPRGGMPTGVQHEYSICNEDWLIGTARRVYKYCVDKQLKPTLELWRCGPELPAKYGFNIVVHF